MAKKTLSLQEKFNKAVRLGDLNDIETLLDAGADPARADAQGNTPLHIAASLGMVVTLRLLLQEKTVDVDARNAKGETPLHAAVQGGFGNTAALEELLAHGADVSLRDNHGKTALMLADTRGVKGDMRSTLRLAQAQYVQDHPVNVCVETAEAINVRRKPLALRPPPK